MTIGERIKEVRLSQAEPTMEQFAKRIGITKGSVSLLESGKNQPSDQTIRSICREFKVNELWLRTGNGSREPSKSLKQEMAELVDDLTDEKYSASFRTALITTLLRFEPGSEKWKLLEEIYEKVAAEYEANKNTAQQQAGASEQQSEN